jgi:hypothetical protein
MPFLKSLIFALFFCSSAFGQTTANHSIARQWNEVLLEAIRNDLARPTVHARNLFHSSIIMFDALAVYDENAEPFLLGNTFNGIEYPFYGVVQASGDEATQLIEEAINYGMYRLLTHRFQNSPGAEYSLSLVEEVFLENGGVIEFTSVDYITDGGASLGNFLAYQIIEMGLQDGSNEVNDHASQFYEPSNPDLLIEQQSGNPDLVNPNSWQPINLSEFVGQSGIGSEEPPPFLSPEWGEVTPFSLPLFERSTHTRNGEDYFVWLDQGAPPLIDLNTTTGFEDPYQWGFSMVIRWSEHLDASDGVEIDISPASIGNLDESLFDLGFEDYDQIYNWADGGDLSAGHNSNPITEEAYTPQIVKRGDYGRVLAEFWADGPDSETPPGHWFVILNYVSDHPEFVPKWQGEGPVLSQLKWDVLSYFTLGGAMHDAAIAAWSHKGWYDYIRPVSAIRWMADQGQCTNPLEPCFNFTGLPLISDWSSLIYKNDPDFPELENVGKTKVRAWKGHGYIDNPLTDVAGVGWILSEDWWPYQRPSFVTPPFAGYVSGHSAFSRAAAEVLTSITGSAYFPGGISEFVAAQNDFLVFEDGPSEDIALQWATYRDAADQCSLSRIWGGIHPPGDDIPGRRLGLKVAEYALVMSNQHINPNGPDQICLGDVTGDGVIGVNDMLAILSYFGSTTVVGEADVDDDGLVGVNDMLVFLSLFGTSCPQ